MKTRHVILAASVLALCAATASATCADTLYLQKLVRTERSWTVKAGKAVDSSVVTRTIPMDSLIQAAPLAVPAGLAGFDTARVLLSFSPDCGTDSVSVARTYVGVDTSKTDIRQNVTRVHSGRFESMSFKGITGTSSANNVKAVILSSGDTVSYQADWSLTSSGADRAAFVLLVPKGGADIEGASVGAKARRYKGNGVSTSFYSLAGTYGSAVTDSMAAFYAKTYLVDQATENAAADSVKIGVLSFKGVYDVKAVSYVSEGAVVGIGHGRSTSRAGISAVAGGWKVTGSGASTGFVRSLDGRLLRRFPATSAFVWDGRGAQGQAVQSGLYLVGFENGETATLPLP